MCQGPSLSLLPNILIMLSGVSDPQVGGISSMVGSSQLLYTKMAGHWDPR